MNSVVRTLVPLLVMSSAAILIGAEDMPAVPPEAACKACEMVLDFWTGEMALEEEKSGLEGEDARVGISKFTSVSALTCATYRSKIPAEDQFVMYDADGGGQMGMMLTPYCEKMVRRLKGVKKKKFHKIYSKEGPEVLAKKFCVSLWRYVCQILFVCWFWQQHLGEWEYFPIMCVFVQVQVY